MNTTPPLYHHLYSEYRFENNARYFNQPVPNDDIFDDEGQIPSDEAFQEIVQDYLNNLSPKKRDKALVDRHRYFLVQQVLNDPRNTTISTAQFRFWVKKMFKIQTGTTDVVCHDNKPVAVREDIYGILVKAHRDAHHGGRDKTSALVRRKYSWIPKELVARFVRHCPFCISRRNNGHPIASRSPRIKHSRMYNSTRTSCSKEDSDFSESGYEATPTFVPLSTSPSPKKLYHKEEYFLNYDFMNKPHPQPQSPLFYHTGYSFYNTNYYSNPLGISQATSPAAAVAVAAASSTAANFMSPTTNFLSHQDRYTENRTNHFYDLNMPENAFSNTI